MKSLWVLSVKTSLPNVCELVSDMKTEFYAFESFDDAKKSLEKKLKELAFSKNAMFDGEGNMIYFKKYLDDEWEPDDGEEIWADALTKSVLSKIYDAIKSIFEGKSTTISSFLGYYDDAMIAVEITNDTMTMRGEDDGPINGYNPTFATNMFDMSEVKDYFLYVDDRFGQDDATSELYIDLKKVDIQG